MGKTNQPLIIWVEPKWWDDTRIAALRERGHLVFKIPDCPESKAPPDVILSGASWRWNDAMWPYLDVALKEARKARKEAKI